MTGKTLSHYKIIEKLGEGGMGVVYKAEDTKLKRTVALKFLPPELTRDSEAKERFINEARVAAALSHPNICTIHEINEAEGQSFIAMECMEGGSLRDKITEGPLKMDEAIDIAAQVAQGLDKAHQKGIVHRDIKPVNIFVTGDGVVKILDFGLAKLRGKTKLTKEGTTLGTVAYMSPEQARGEEVNHRTDIWSLGIVLYEMVTGQLPFKGDYEQAVVYSILNEEPEPMTGLRTGVPMELERVVHKTMKKNPDERYQNISDMLVDLKAVTRGVESSKTEKYISEAKRSRIKYVYICAALLAIFVFTIFGKRVLFTERSEAIDSVAVLPLENLSKDPEQECFADGMTEALIADLAKISALRVISRTSVMRYKDTGESLPEIAKDLNVDAIVEGSVLLAGDRVRITAQLIETASDRHIWAESYERDLRDILSLQRDVAKAIAHEVEVTLTPQEEVTLAAAPQVDPEAHEAYLKGRHHWNKRGKVDLERSIEYFQYAIEKDPDFAMAYVGLAEAYTVLADWGFQPPKQMYPKAMETALKALEIDPALASAHATIGAVQSLYYYDQRESEEEYQRAISLNPNYATAHQWYAEYLFRMKRFDEALAEIERALELDPLSLNHALRSGSKVSLFRPIRQSDSGI